MEPREVQQKIFRLSEQLRIAIKNSNVNEALNAFDMTKLVFEESEGLAARGVLALELVQFLVDLGIAGDMPMTNPEVNNLINDCLIFGRSDQLFTEVMATLIRLEEVGSEVLITDLVDLSISAALFSDNDSLLAHWWSHFYALLVQGNTLEAVETFGTFKSDEVPKDSRIMTLQIEALLDELGETDEILESFSSSRPMLKEILLTYGKNSGMERRMLMHFLISQVTYEISNEVFIALAVVFENRLSIDDELPESNRDKNGLGHVSSDLSEVPTGFPSTDEDSEITDVTLNSGVTVRWDEAKICWLGDDGSEWMLIEESPYTWIPKDLWSVAFPGRSPKYVRPRPKPPEKPDRNLAQQLHYLDDRERNRVLNLGRKKIYDRAISEQLSHFKRTGRWLLGNPPMEGWYPDPLRKFDLRFWNNSHWTELVMESDKSLTIDPNFPKSDD